jgi:hypothetical protein
VSCAPGYYLNSYGLCIQLNSLCLSYDQNTGGCLSCPYGYILIGYICWNVIIQNPYCSTFNGVTCTACLSGYYLNNGICYLGNAFCSSIDSNTGYCIGCVSGFTLNSGLCIANVNCTTYASNGACLTCPSGYIVFSGLCVNIQNANPFC